MSKLLLFSLFSFDLAVCKINGWFFVYVNGVFCPFWPIFYSLLLPIVAIVHCPECFITHPSTNDHGLMLCFYRRFWFFFLFILLSVYHTYILYTIGKIALNHILVFSTKTCDVNFKIMNSSPKSSQWSLFFVYQNGQSRIIKPNYIIQLQSVVIINDLQIGISSSNWCDDARLYSTCTTSHKCIHDT